ncbi:MAG: hypothetical protein P8Y71_13625 [Pseudolabrys sp.]
MAMVAILTLAALIYWPGAGGGFTLDDYPNIVDNPAIHIHHLDRADIMGAALSSRSGPLARPISMLTFALNEYLWGPAPYSMKATNILIHVGNGLLIYSIALLIFAGYRRQWRPQLNQVLARWAAVAITAAWLLLPINLTAVLYVVQRMTSLSGTFVLTGVALYLAGRLRMLEGQRGFSLLWLAMVVCGALAVLTKEIGVLLPVYTLVIEFTLFRFLRADGRRDRRLYLFYGLVLVVPGVLGLFWLATTGSHSLLGNAGRPFTIGQRLLTEPRVMLDYIAWSLAPTLSSLSLYHDDYRLSTSLAHPATTPLAIAGVALLLAIGLWQRRRRPLLSLGILWFFGGQLLTATIFNLELVYEHRNYLPSFGLLMAVFSLLLLEPRVERMALPRRGLVVALVTVYAAILAIRVNQWSDPIRYQAIAAAEHPESARATYALGRTYSMLVNGPNSRFLPLAKRAFQQAMRAPSASILPEQGLLWLSAKYQVPVSPEWWESMERKLTNRPASAQDTGALHSLVDCQLRRECGFPEDKMIRLLAIARDKNPRNPDILTVDANYTFNILHNPTAARRMMRTAVELAATNPQYWINIIKLDIYLGRLDDARSEIHRLRDLNRFGSLDKRITAVEDRFTTAVMSRPRDGIRGTHPPKPVEHPRP